MNEKLLQFIWKHQLLDISNLLSMKDENIKIINPGKQNTNSGPDFLEAQILINDIKWVGNIEIHVKESDWIRHQHQQDENYNHIILHVVFENDIPINTNCPVLCVAPFIDSLLVERYSDLMKNEQWVACASDISKINPILRRSTLDKILIERIENKINLIYEEGTFNNNNWIEITNHIIFSNFGFKLNNETFLLLSRSIPQVAIEQNRNNLFRMEALLFGQAGLLNNEFNDEYPLLLWEEYMFLKQKYKLNPIPSHLWKFMRTRPSNFPTIRIAQLAAFIHIIGSNFIEEICYNEISWIENKLDSIKASFYWESHYNFDKSFSEKKSTKFGTTAKHLFIVNAISQLIFAYGKMLGNEKWIDKALLILEAQKAEMNHITKKWTECGISPQNASDSQALIHLKNSYCENKSCLECGIGYHIIKKKT